MTTNDAITALNSISSNLTSSDLALSDSTSSDSTSSDSCSTNLTIANSIELTPDMLSVNNNQGLTWVASSWENSTCTNLAYADSTSTNSSWQNYWYRDRDYLLPSYTLPHSITTESTITTIEECFTIEYFKDRLNDLNKLFKKYNINIIFKYESNKSENNESKSNESKNNSSENNLNPNEYSALMEYITQLMKCIVQNSSTPKDELKQIYETIKVANYFAKKFFE